MQIIHSLRVFWYLIYKLKSEKIFRIISYPNNPCHLSTGYFFKQSATILVSTWDAALRWKNSRLAAAARSTLLDRSAGAATHLALSRAQSPLLLPSPTPYATATYFQRALGQTQSHTGRQAGGRDRRWTNEFHYIERIRAFYRTRRRRSRRRMRMSLARCAFCSAPKRDL